MSTIPLVDLQTQYRSIKSEIDQAIQAVLDRGQFILGPEVEALEHDIAAYCGTKHAVGVASGTDALELSLRALGIGPGDEVITTAFGFFATAEAIFAAGATPIFVDIELASYNLDPARLQTAITPRTKAIIPVHLFGHPCDLDPVMQIARQHHLKIVEDCAQAIGAQYRGRRVGSFGDAGALSFYPTKNLGGYGDGGMVVTNDSAVAEQLRLLRVHGSRERYHHLIVGTNSRLDELQAAILRVKLHHLDQWNASRRQHAQAYAEALQRYCGDRVVLPKELPGCTHTYHLYSIRISERQKMQRLLEEQGIATQIAYPSPLPAQPALRAHANYKSSYLQAEAAAREILSLPMYPELTSEIITHVVSTFAHAGISSSSRR